LDDSHLNGSSNQVRNIAALVRFESHT